MKSLSFFFLFVALWLNTLTIGSAEMVVYSASDAAHLNPDANLGATNAWSVATNSGGQDSFNGTFFDGTNWGLYANTSNEANMFADVSALLPLSGRDLGLAGDQVSLFFQNGNVDFGGAVGVEFLDETGSRQMEFVFRGGESNYEVTDFGRTFTGTPAPFTSSGFTLGLTLVDTVGGYTLDIGGTAFGGTFINGDSTVATVRVFNFNAGAGSASNLLVNHLALTAIPEPSSLMTFACLLSVAFRRRR